MKHIKILITYATRLLKIPILIFLIVLLTACGGGTTDPDGGSDAEKYSVLDIVESDFTVSPIFTLSEKDFKEALNDTEEFLAEEEPLIDAEQANVDCMLDQMGGLKATRNEQNTYDIKVADTDVTRCFDMPEIELKSVVVGMYGANIKYKDDSGNLATSDEITFNDLNNRYTVVQSNSRMYMNMRYDVTVAGTKYNVVGIFIGARNETDHFNQPCQLEAVLSNCTAMEVTHVDVINAPVNSGYDKTVLYANGLTIVEGEPYFTDGEVVFEMNNWTGTMTYDADASTAPTYKASDGAQNITGTYEPDSGDTAHSHKPSVHIESQDAMSLIKNTLGALHQITFAMSRGG